MKIKNWINISEHQWKNIRNRDEVGIRRVDNLYIAYVKIHSRMFQRVDISNRPQTLLNANSDAILYMRKNP